MNISIRGYITHKESEKYSDCADRYAINTATNRFAIADGVSKSFFPDYWAEVLVNKFVSLDFKETEWIEKCQEEWLIKVAEKANSPDAKWYTKNAFNTQQPGLATFVGLKFDNGKWSAIALGDSFLFFIPNEAKGFDDWIKLSSKTEPYVFDNFPDYYSSRGNQHHGNLQRISDKPLSEGTFYLMTDALSEWVIKEKDKAIEEIHQWKCQAEFERSITELREQKVLNNDDSAILIISLENDGKNTITYSDINIQSLKELVDNEKQSKAEQNNTSKKETFMEKIKESKTPNDNVENNSVKKYDENNLTNNRGNDKINLSKKEKKIYRWFNSHPDSREKLIRKLIEDGYIPFKN